MLIRIKQSGIPIKRGKGKGVDNLLRLFFPDPLRSSYFNFFFLGMGNKFFFLLQLNKSK